MRYQWKVLLAKVQPEVSRLLAANAHGSAAARLGEVLLAADSSERPEVCGVISGIFPIEAVSLAVAESTKELRKALHIASIGTVFNFDEIVLLLTMRTEIACVAALATALLPDVAPVELGSLDSELSEIAHEKANRAAFGRALSAMRKNSNVDLIDIWSTSVS